ncbi:MAG: hypothetical protein ABEJ89_09310 [Haloarculaceae archaeon]
MSTIAIRDVAATGTTLESSIAVPAPLRRFFTGESFRATYGVDISDVDESVLAIPVVGHVAPVAWTQGVDLAVPALDSEYRDCLRAVQERLRSMYPGFMDGGTVFVRDSVDNDEPTGTGTGLLFSGGVDSVTSFARHDDEITTLIGVQGWTIDDEADEEWERVAARIGSFADRHGVDSAFVRSNALSMLDTTMLGAHYKRYLVGSWYSGVGHGLGLLSLCAPLSVAGGIDSLHIASTHTAAFEYPWGSHPTIDEHVRWGGARANHDGYELDRQEKLYRIARFVESEDPQLKLHTCNRGEADNCNDCEKCYRTAIGLFLADLDPRDHGYDIGPEDLDHAREAVESGEWLVDEHFRFMWETLQSHAPEGFDHESEPVRKFLRWLAEVDIDACYQRGANAREDRWGRVLRTVARNTPYPVYASLYPVYDRVVNSARGGPVSDSLGRTLLEFGSDRRR